jgi:uncharacterized protein (TIGR03089 family)
MHRQVRRRGHQPYLTFYDDDSGERTELSYATFDNWTAKTANLLAEQLGVRPGKPVATVLGTSWIAVVAAFACWKVGAALWPIDARALRESDSLPQANATFLREDLLGTYRGLQRQDVIAVGSGPAGRLATDVGDVVRYAEEVAAFGDDYDDPAVALDDDGLVVPGSRGAHVRLDQHGLLAAADALGAWGLSEGDRLLCAVGTASVEGLVLACLGAFAAGASVVLVRGQQPGGFWQRVITERVTLAMLPEAMLGRLPQGDSPGFRGFLAPGRPGRAAGASRSVSAAGTPRHDGHPVFRGQGVVEATCASTLGPLGLDPETRGWVDGTGLSYAGCATVHADVAALAPDGSPLPRGTLGELGVRGPVVASGHWFRDDLDDLAFAGGWLHTGQEGVIHPGPDGREHVFVTGEH